MATVSELYTSPHLLRLEERFVINGQIIDASQLVAGVEAVAPAAERIAKQGHGAATFFELTTAIAWWLFRENQVDANVIEVGLGGRLDSTNVCWPALSIITSISYDHQQQLGSTLSEIAGEKAGIIKPGVPVISGATHPEAAAVIRRVACDRGCQLRELQVDFTADRLGTETDAHGERRQTIRYQHRRTLQLPLRMAGRHQSANAGVVLASLDVLREHGWTIDDTAVADAFATTQVAARIETVSRDPMIIVDTAHKRSLDRRLD